MRDTIGSDAESKAVESLAVSILVKAGGERGHR